MGHFKDNFKCHFDLSQSRARTTHHLQPCLCGSATSPMVLKNSKYDKQAKKQYMAKHGLLKPREAPIVRPKWSGKKKLEEQEYMKLDVDEMTSDWDSETDEDIVNYFYPQLKDELVVTPLEQKRKIKRQVIEDLKIQRNELFNQSSEDHQKMIEEREQNGIFLGSEQPQVKLTEFIPQIPITKRKTRKLPINEDSQDLLSEYGIDNYADLIRKKQDYDALHEKKLALRNLNDISTDELIGFEVGKDKLGASKKKSANTIRQLTQEEIELENERKAKIEQQKFYDHVKQKFLGKNDRKVLELNNLKQGNQQHIDYINLKLSNTKDEEIGDFDNDLDELLGSKIKNLDIESGAKNEEEAESDEIEFLNSLAQPKSKPQSQSQVKPQLLNSTIPDKLQEDFLDDLLS